MNEYGLGVILGRLFACYLIVFVVLFFSSNFKAKLAVEKSLKWYSLLAIAILFVVGISVSTTQSGAI